MLIDTRREERIVYCRGEGNLALSLRHGSAAAVIIDSRSAGALGIALFRRAVEMETVTAELIRRVAACPRRAQSDPGLVFEA
jgi:hypothetical protein